MRKKMESRSHEVAKAQHHNASSSCLRAFVVQSVLVFGICAITGCNYNSGYSSPGSEPKGWYQWRSLYREDVKTVAVPIFKTKDYRRGVEFALSKALVNQIEMRTPYKVVERGKADTVMEGEIVEIKGQTIRQERT